MSDQVQKIKCGDTPHCEECATRTSDHDTTGNAPAFITLNGMGRCDFYMANKGQATSHQ